MDLVNKQDIPGLEIGHQCSNVAGLLKDRPAGRF